ncbi:2-amino-4-hydroxy-6-hydroxymethyldihydropteridine diphosphokinase [candidate division WOR-1 bacterium RIFCSPHIGHO2_01_FULL_53_15]|uniref:2-amino-4-hydroxy-6-hydroxymethyldihydropteridine diphosphokinase n=1 Tax=candidate division WOR-1 bacterium RIFCSPHIGHO2_01_FULL_53_15 TaxID=1802564 RepID=A0A1F4Q2N5_UNCSA|nr:MAG: 2-amino-4-hydroxy-6-hydroxymethyldihydropteridine diphosphokinase [candidate division WOR-1 bacterium RIFCSPHIGHO2_01_FULL_53_15]OGC13214.1 MAG: 2-amino-4-hydroxy-6-hydroxymethyldihydropteridine diphosphokinase [candidate division WOR-1 bacterium RIFCSPHIGHO2_02_FULL_53_26]
MAKKRKAVKTKKTLKKKATAAKAKKTKKKAGPAKVYLGLGSNVGDREEYIEQVIFLLEKNPNIQVTKRSSNYETEAEGGADQPAFMNAAVAIITKLPPEKLLEVCQEIETALGRDRETEWGPRTMDIDILLFDDQIVSDDKLQVPHPLMHERMFVLKPLKEIAPHAIHPVLEKSIEDLFEERKAEGGEKYDDELPGFKDIKTGGYDDYERW